jgi:hypothetical protein
MRSRRCWLGRSEKDRFDMAYSTGFRKLERKQSQLTRVMVAVGEKMGATERMGKQRRKVPTRMPWWCGEGGQKRESYPFF